VESSYDGPKFEDGKITKEFIEGMMEHFKKQKKIHLKYAYQVSSLHFYYPFFFLFDIFVVMANIYLWPDYYSGQKNDVRNTITR